MRFTAHHGCAKVGDMNPLAEKQLVHPAREADPLSEDQTRELLEQLPGWERLHEVEADKLRRRYTLKNFAEALRFTNRIGELAEQENHHPAITTEWGKVTVTWWTHWLSGLHINDYIMAARTDRIFREFNGDT